jgi:hypothetical protein
VINRTRRGATAAVTSGGAVRIKNATAILRKRRQRRCEKQLFIKSVVGERAAIV